MFAQFYNFDLQTCENSRELEMRFTSLHLFLGILFVDLLVDRREMVTLQNSPIPKISL